MKTLIKLGVGTIVVPLALLSACSPERRADGRSETPPVSASSARADADNSARNQRDRSGETLTPLDQGSSEADRDLTQLVRQQIVDQDEFSVDAKNVKIITQNGVVTLRGPVETAQEKARIGAIAAAASGVQRVDNQVEVEAETDR